jgi:hypothetical protein
MENDQTVSELAARIAELNDRRGQLEPEEERLRAELIELFERIKKLRDRPPVIGNEPHDPPLPAE